MEDGYALDEMESRKGKDGDSSWFIQILRDVEERERNEAWPLLPYNPSAVTVTNDTSGPVRRDPRTDVMEPEEGKEYSDAPVEEVIRSEPLVSFTGDGDSSWLIKLLQDLEELEQNQAWPLLPKKYSSASCDKCQQEYISSINYRRHQCDSNLNEEALNRETLGNFWDKLSLEDAKEVVSFTNKSLEEVAGSSIVKALSDIVQEQGLSPLPPSYMKAGSEILDIIQGKACRFPISSDEFFSLLDCASERTFLRGSVVSMKEFILFGNPGKTSLERKNLVALSSFLLEQNLKDAWKAEKYAEKSRVDNIQLEEKESARKRRTQVVEKGRDDMERCDVTLGGKENDNQKIMVPNVKDLEDKDVAKDNTPHGSQTNVMESEEGKESSDILMKEVIGSEQLTKNDCSWFIHHLRALEEQEKNLAWAMLPSNLSSIPMQKCDKCSQEYISAINYRRHNCDSKNPDPGSVSLRNWLRIFWDKLSTEDAKEVVSFKNIYLEEVAGSSIVKALSDLVRKPGFSPLPIFYMKAGSEILDIIQGKASRFPVSFDEFLCVLDDASERTFLHGSVVSLKKQFFDENPVKTGLESNNLVACSSILLEENLIDAWRADMKASKLSSSKKLQNWKSEVVEKRRRDGGSSDVTSGRKDNVNRNIPIPIVNASEETAVMKETIADASDSEKKNPVYASDLKKMIFDFALQSKKTHVDKSYHKKTEDTLDPVPLDNVPDSEEGKESSDTPLDENSSRFIQLLRDLDEQERNQASQLLPNNHSSMNVPMQKCDKCLQEYISSINYKRHQCSSKLLDEESSMNRKLLGNFWDQLSLEDAKEVVSFNNISLEEVAGSSIEKALLDLVQKPGFSPLPVSYMKAGTEILNIIQGKTSRLPISSDEFFALLDNASERVFLRGSTKLLKSRIFDWNPGKTGLEMRNVVACSSFLLEESLIKAIIADGDAAKRDVKESNEPHSASKIDVSETNVDNSVEKEVFNGSELEGTYATGSVENIDVDKPHKKPVDTPSPETDSADVVKSYARESNETHSASKIDVSETNDNNSAEKEAFHGPEVKDTDGTGSVEKTDVDKASHKKPVDTPSPETDSVDVANVDRNSGQIERGRSLNEEGEFVRKQRHWQRRGQDVIPTVSGSARATSTEKPVVAPPGNYFARGTPTEKASKSFRPCSPSLKPPGITGSNNTARGTPKLNPGVMPPVNLVPRGAPSSSYVFRSPPAPKQVIPRFVAYRPVSNPVVSPPSSHSAQATRAWKPVDPSPSAQATRAWKPVIPPPAINQTNFPSLASSVSIVPSQREPRFPKHKRISKQNKHSSNSIDKPAKAETSDKPALDAESSHSKARDEEEASQAKEVADKPALGGESSLLETQNEKAADKSPLDEESSQAKVRNEEVDNKPPLDGESSQTEARNKEATVLERAGSQAKARNKAAADDSTKQNETADHSGAALLRGNLFEIRDRDSAIAILEDFNRKRWREALAGEHKTVGIDIPCSPRNA